jgi:hypothetical protein
MSHASRWVQEVAAYSRNIDAFADSALHLVRR